MARRGDYSQPKLNARQRYLARVNYNQQVAQVEDLYRQGLTYEDVRAIQESWKTDTPYVVKDGDTLPSIANANNTTEADILKTNPNVNRLQTGMVVNLPGGLQIGNVPGLPTSSQAGTIPSNAAQGAAATGLSTNREQPTRQTLSPGNPIDNAVFGTAVSAAAREGRLAQGVTNFFGNTISPLISAAANAIPQNVRRGALNVIAPFVPSPLGLPGAIAAQGAGWVAQNIYQNRPTGTGAPAGAGQPPGTPATPAVRPSSYKYTPSNIVTVLDNIQSQIGPTGRLPNAYELEYLLRYGVIKPGTTLADIGGGGYGYARGRGGRGGGGGGGGREGLPGQMLPRDYANARQERPPAFGSGAGFRGLVNWRI